jgi:hypothetical protein
LLPKFSLAIIATVLVAVGTVESLRVSEKYLFAKDAVESERCAFQSRSKDQP